MLFAKALKAGVVGPDFTGKNYTFALNEERLVNDDQRGFYEQHPACFSVFSNNALGSTAGGGISSTDGLTEGASNLYFTVARVRAVALTGLSLASSAAITAADTVLSAIGKLQAQLTKFVDQVNVFTKAQRGQIVALGHASNVYTPDFSAGNFFSFTPAANFTLSNPTNLPAAGITQSGSFFITQDATGGRVATFGNAYAWAGGTAGVLSTAANARDRIDYVIEPTGLVHLSIAKDVRVSV